MRSLKKSVVCLALGSLLFTTSLNGVAQNARAPNAIQREFAPALECVLREASAPTTAETPEDASAIVLAKCNRDITVARNKLTAAGWPREKISEVEALLERLLVKAWQSTFSEAAATKKRESEFGRGVYFGALSCASKAALDYKELAAGEPAIFRNFIESQCHYEEGMYGIALPDIKLERAQLFVVIAENCAFADALLNLNFRLDRTLSELAESCPKFFELVGLER